MLKLIPNILTFGRLVLTVIFLIMLLYSPTVANHARFLDIAFIIFVIAGLTDIIDGKVARMLKVTSKLGRMMDPLADKILVCGTFICFAIIGEPKLFTIPEIPMTVIRWTVVAVLVFREVYVTLLRHIAEARGINFAATSSGKLKMFLQSFAIGTVVIKTAHLPTVTWGNCLTTVVYILMITSTVTSGLRATKRSTLQKDAP